MGTNRMLFTGFGIFVSVFLVLLPSSAVAQSDAVSDTENCLYCHRYPSMGRYDKDGKKRIFYINEEKFVNSVHGNLSCKNCHVGLDVIPHTDVKKVDCSTKCHIEEPSTKREFSHANMIQKYKDSVHGKAIEEKPEYSEDLPTCKYCHNNIMYNPLSGMWGKSEELSNETLARCLGCHTEPQWTERFYSHFTHRMRRRRTQNEIVELCTSCHEDKEKMYRHGLESIDTYKDTYHWAQVKYGMENAPDCVTCHIPVGDSTHEIRRKTDPDSPIHLSNRVKTCSNQGGVQVCHPGAKSNFARGRVHAYGEKVRIAAEKNPGKPIGTAVELISARAIEEIPDEDVFRYNVLKLIRLFYQVFIAVVVGSMVLHQFLDYHRARKNHKR